MKWMIPGLMVAVSGTFVACDDETKTPIREAPVEGRPVAEPELTARDESPRSVSVTEVNLGRSITAAKQIVDEEDDFAPTDTIYASVRIEGEAERARLKAVWKTEGGDVIAEDETELTPAGTAFTEFHIRQPDGLPEGEYTISIMLDGEEVATEDFEIERG